MVSDACAIARAAACAEGCFHDTNKNDTIPIKNMQEPEYDAELSSKIRESYVLKHEED